MPDTTQEPTRHPRSFAWLTALALLVLLAAHARGVQVQDIVRLRGAEGMHLTGVGLVVGLDGTGDKKIGPAHKMLKQQIARLVDDTATLDELAGVKSVAMVSISARIPETGVVAGDRLDCYVEINGGATSLLGGRLEPTPIMGPIPEPTDPEAPRPPGSGVFGFASGSLVLEDPDDPSSARIVGGLHVIRDVTPAVLNGAGQIELVLKEPNASWPVAKNLAALINGLGPLGQEADIAFAVSPKRVLVELPPAERRRPAAFIARVLESYIDRTQVTSGARVVINERARVIVVDHDVEFTPTIITVKGMTISRLDPAPDPALAPPREVTDRFVAVDPRKDGGARLQDLLDAFNLLDVPFDDQANVIKTLHELGNLHARLEVHQ